MYDGFNRAAASDLGPRWQTLAGAVQIDAGSARAAADGSLAVIHGVTRTTLVAEASLRRPTATTDNAYIAFRVVNAANYYYAGYNTPGTFAIYRVVNGVTTKLAVSSGPPVPLPPGTPTPTFPDRVRVIASGSTLRLYRGAALVVEVIDATFAAGLVGIVGNNGGRLEDFVMA